MPAAAPSPALQRQAQAILDQSGGTAAMVLAQPGKAPLVAINASQVMPSASLYKLGVMAAVYQAAANGRVSFDQQLTITQDEVDTYGDAPATDPGTTLPVSELLRRMITVSDNSAAGALIDLVGAQAVNAAFAANGMPSSHLGDGDSVAETTAADQVAFYQRLLDGKVVDKNASNAMLNLLEAQQENDRLPAELPPGTVVAHKTGELEDVRNDSGIIFTPAGPVICAVLISDQPQASLSIGAIAGEGHLAYRALIPAASGSRP